MISIILPTYNGEKYINRAIDSVISQTFLDWELIIINDGSNDNTEEILKKYIVKDKRIIYLSQDNQGPNRARQKGIDNSRGEYIAFLDVDDIWIDKDKLKKQIEFLESNRDHVLVGTGVVNVDDNKEINRYFMPETDENIRQKFLRINCFVNSSILFRKVVLNNVKNSDSLLEDYDFCLQLGLLGKIANLKRYSVEYYFKFDGYGSQNKIKRFKENLSISKKYKNYYPNYWKAFIFGYIKMYTLPLFKLLPIRLKGFFIKLHKKL